MEAALPIPQSELNAWYRRWRVVELALFGSVLREEAIERSANPLRRHAILSTARPIFAPA